MADGVVLGARVLGDGGVGGPVEDVERVAGRVAPFGVESVLWHVDAAVGHVLRALLVEFERGGGAVVAVVRAGVVVEGGGGRHPRGERSPLVARDRPHLVVDAVQEEHAAEFAEVGLDFFADEERVHGFGYRGISYEGVSFWFAGNVLGSTHARCSAADVPSSLRSALPRDARCKAMPSAGRPASGTVSGPFDMPLCSQATVALALASHDAATKFKNDPRTQIE